MISKSLKKNSIDRISLIVFKPVLGHTHVTCLSTGSHFALQIVKVLSSIIEVSLVASLLHHRPRNCNYCWSLQLSSSISTSAMPLQDPRRPNRVSSYSTKFRDLSKPIYLFFSDWSSFLLTDFALCNVYLS